MPFASLPSCKASRWAWKATLEERTFVWYGFGQMTEQREHGDTYVNVPMDAESASRIQAQERAWDGTKLTIFGVVFLGACLVMLWAMANLHGWLGISDK